MSAALAPMLQFEAASVKIMSSRYPHSHGSSQNTHIQPINYLLLFVERTNDNNAGDQHEMHMRQHRFNTQVQPIHYLLLFVERTNDSDAGDQHEMHMW